MKRVSLRKDKTEGESVRGAQMANEKERLFDLLIHDLSGPLSIITASTAGLLQRSSRYGPLTDQQRRVLERILRNAYKAQGLLQEMIEIFQSEEGIFRKEHFPIGRTLMESLTDVLEIVAPNIAEKACGIEKEEAFKEYLETHDIFIQITGPYCQSSFCHDPKKIRQILRNLISNALKYRRKRMSVSISGETDLQVLVEDDGQGISLKDQDDIFQRFVQLNGKKTSDIPGVGLGLSGVKTLVKAMGGEIRLESRVGFGARLLIRIPPLH